MLALLRRSRFPALLGMASLCVGTAAPEYRELPKFPPDSTLSGLRVPSYDENRKIQALLTVGVLEVLDEDRFLAKGIKVEVFDTQGSATSSLNLTEAKINRLTSVLTSDDPVAIRDANAELDAKGVVFSLQTKQTYFLGPGSFQIDPDAMKDRANENARKAAPSPTRMLAAAAVSSVMLATSSAARIPGDVTPETLQQMALLEQTWGERLATEADTTGLATSAEDVETIDRALLDFAAAAEIPIQAAAENKDPAIAEPDAEELAKKHRIQTTFDGGMYVDPEELALVLVENIVFEDRLNRITLRCAGEVKIFFNEEKPREGEEDKERNAFSRLGDLKSVVATGGIDVVRIMKDGRRVRLTGGTLHYDAAQEIIIVKDGRPTMTHPDGFMRAKQNGQRLILRKDGTYSAPGSWDLSAKPPKN